MMNEEKYAKVYCTLSGRQCKESKGSESVGDKGEPNGVTFCGVLSPLEEKTETSQFRRCYNPALKSAYDYCANFWSYDAGPKDYFGYVQIEASGVDLNDMECNSAYRFDRRPLNSNEKPFGIVAQTAAGVLKVGEQSTQLTARTGFAVTEKVCKTVHGKTTCAPSRLSRLKVALQDLVIAGIPFTNTELNLLEGADSVAGMIPAKSMHFEVSTVVLGTKVSFLTSNQNPMPLSSGSSSLSLAGEFAMDAMDLNEGKLPISISMGLGATTSAPSASCAGLTQIGRLFSFESPALWRSNEVQLKLSSRTASHGCSAMDVPGTGYRVVMNSAPFTTPLPGATSKIGLDVFIPVGQPNPYWLGAVQMYATCSSAQMNNAYIGQVELTGKPIGAFSTITFTVPGSIQSVLNGSHPDCYFSIAVNMNQAPTAATLDNLRFLP